GFSMQRRRRFIQFGVSLLLIGSLAGCGGGGGKSSQPVPPPPPPPPADFTVSLSPAALSETAGTTSPATTLSTTALNGFSASIQVTLSGLPAGVNANPASPFSVSAGGSQSVVFGATGATAPGAYTITAKAASGALSHSTTLTLTVQAGSPPPVLSRMDFVRTDSLPASDEPSGEPRHRRMVYDSARKRLYVANAAMNRIEALSTADGSLAGEVAVPGVTSVDLSADGTTLWAGSRTEQITALDAATFSAIARYPVAGIAGPSNTVYNLPVEVASLSGGKALARLRRADAASFVPALWDSATNTFTDLTSRAPTLFASGAGVFARSADHTKILAAAADASGSTAVFDASGNIIAGPVTVGSGNISLAAANADGSAFAVVLNSSGTAQIFLLNSTLSSVASRPTTAPQGLVFSRDGATLYVSENADLPPVITALGASDLHLIGQRPDARAGGRHSEIEEVDETGLLFGIANRGVSFVDAVNPAALPATAPAFSGAQAASPAEGTLAGGAAVNLAGQNFESSVQLKFAAQAAPSATVSNAAQIQTVAPPGTAAGPANITAYFPSGWVAIAPAAFSYGPHIAEVLPNTSKKEGGENIQIYGYGFGADATKISVTIGGASAPVQNLEDVTALTAAGVLAPNYPFPIERLTVQTPAGSPGKTDLTVSAPAGNTTAAKAFQYLQSVQVNARPGLYKFALYDPKRHWVYLSNTDHVDVFDLQLAQFQTSGLPPPGGPPPNAGLRGMALTPDNATLAVADFGAQSVYLLNPDAAGSGTTVFLGGVAGFTSSGPARVAPTNLQTVFVGLSGEGGSTGACTGCLQQINLAPIPPTVQAGPQPVTPTPAGAPLVQSSSAGDRVVAAYGAVPGGPVALWNSSTPNLFTSSAVSGLNSEVNLAGDGVIFAVRRNGSIELRGADFSLAAIPSAAELEAIPGSMSVPGAALHPSGALLYLPFLTAAAGSTGVRGGVDIVDARSGTLRLRIFLPNPLLREADAIHGSFLAIDEYGEKLFAITSTNNTPYGAGLTIVQLAQVPLAIGNVAPSSGSVAGGTPIIIRGSGFQSGTKVSIGGTNATATFVDMNTLHVTTPAMATGAQRILLTNPDGETAAADALFAAN
ncbi:MAG: IPT/TIG domain-containing protein, partial [Acidobacteriia bacterium]|nr:IPT/TIG domain-containing protein [Terriglobia bacterium]